MKKLFALFVFFGIASAMYSQTYAVGHTQVTFTDPARSNRQIQTEIYYPAATAGNNVPVTGSSYPVIVFGHGFVMTWSAYQNIWEAFVPHGYIVAFPTTEGSFSPTHAEFGMDISFLIGKLQSEGNVNTSSIFYNHVGTTSAAMGHSMGGGAAFLACENNAQITTMITFAAANTTPSSIAASGNITIPALVIAGQNDCVAPPVQHQVPMYDSLLSSCKAYVEITGGGHCYFAENNFNCSFGEGTCSPNPSISRVQQQDAAQDFALLWLNYFLKDDCAAWQNFNDSVSLSNRVTANASCTTQFPVISQNGNFLSSTPASTYQWLLNGVPIAGAINQNYTPVQNGLYSVVVTYNNSCGDTSNILSFTLLGLPDADCFSDIYVFPNPGTSVLNLSFVGYSPGKAMLYVCNSSGEEIIVKQLIVQRGKNIISMEFDSEKSGFYSVRIIMESGQTQAVRFMKL